MQNVINSLKEFTITKAAATGSLGGFLYEFILVKGHDLLFVIVAGVLGALAGASTKLLFDFIFNKNKNKNGTDQ